MSSPENLDYFLPPSPEFSSNKIGVVILLVNGNGKLLFGLQRNNTSRGNKGEYGVMGESCEDGEELIDTLRFGLMEELGASSEMRRNIRWTGVLEDHDLGETVFLDDIKDGQERRVLAHVFVLRWSGGNHQLPPKYNYPIGVDHDFKALGWRDLKGIKELSLRKGMLNVFERANGNLENKIEQIAKMTKKDLVPFIPAEYMQMKRK